MPTSGQAWPKEVGERAVRMRPLVPLDYCTRSRT
jgi:hypothetical protein